MEAKKKPLRMEEFIHRVYEISIEAMLPRDYRNCDPAELCKDLCDEIEVLYAGYQALEAENTRLRILRSEVNG